MKSGAEKRRMKNEFERVRSKQSESEVLIQVLVVDLSVNMHGQVMGG